MPIRAPISRHSLGGIIGNFLTYLVSTAVGLATSVGIWGTGAHSMGLLPHEAFVTAANFGIILPPMPR